MNPVHDAHLCRLSIWDTERQIAGPPHALRALATHLRTGTAPIAITGGTIDQQITDGPLLIRAHGTDHLRVSGHPDHLRLLWDALTGTADDADTTPPAGVNRHTHIEYYGDPWTSPDTEPLAVVADWP
ncbi:Imm32 family immunity protein [Actinoplanes sp. G11-F43]|uniref:Imm32 family immunity protein n=1 Tax=Actinoplanes sp. G11-F43 TaxID=3424130 RepID=UPI003D327789